MSSPKSVDNQSRFFLALWPDSQIRDKIAALQALLPAGGVKTPPENLHITLFYIGRADENDLDLFCQSLNQIHFQPFNETIDSWGYFSGSQVTWIGPSQPSEQLKQLRKKTAESGLAFQLDGLEHGYVPHITLSRQSPETTFNKQKAQGWGPFQWPVNAFYLVESNRGTYSTRARFTASP